MSESPSQSRSQYLLPDGLVPVVVSADAEDRLGRYAASVAGYLREHPDVDVDRVAAYLLDARPVRRHRAVAAVADRDALLDALDAVADGRPHPDVVRGSAASHRFAYVYPGQGSQRPGMGAVDYRCSAAYRTAVDDCHEASMELFGTSPIDYVLGRDAAVETDDVTVVQPALFMHMLGLTAMWDAAGVRPAMTVGHSQGEIAAAVRSGVASLREALVVVTMRARAVDAIAPRGYTMAVLGVSLDEAEALLARNSGWIELSVVNSAHILCVSGERPAVLGLIAALEADGKFAKEIRVAYPAHTSIVSKFAAEFVTAFDSFGLGERFSTPRIPCIGATLGEAIDETMTLRDYWFWNLRNRVRFDRAVATAATDGADTFIEIAEHPTLVLAMSETLAETTGTTILGTRRRECTDHSLFTKNVLAVAVADSAFDWSRWAVPGRTRHLPLEGFPNSTMRKTRLWARFDAGATDPVNRPGWATTTPDHDVRVLRTEWQRPSSRKLVAPQRIAVLTPAGADRGFAATICETAPSHGAVAWQLPDGGAEIGEVDAALLLLPAGTDDVEADLAGLLADEAWRGGLTELPAVLWVATTGGETVGPDEAADPFHAAAAAALRCLAVEQTGARVAQLDLPVEGTASADDVLSAIHVGGESALALRDGVIHVKRLVPAEVPASHDLDLAHVLISGGTGRVGLAMAERFARDGARRLTLLSRSGGDDEARRTVARLTRRFGVSVDVVRIDLTDAVAVADVLGGLRTVTTAVHAALDYVDRPLSAIDAADVHRALDAKVGGLGRILDALDESPRVLVCSSLAATLGGRDQALYAAANRLLEVEAARLRAVGVDAAAVGWGLWAVQGPLDADGLARVTATGVVPMAPQAALDAGLGIRGFDAQVMAASWPDLRALLAMTGTAALVSDVLDLVAGAPEVAEDPRPLDAPPAEVAEPETAEYETVAEQPGPAESGDLMTDLVAELAVAMDLPTSDIDPGAPLVALGMDSLQALDFRKRVQASLACDLPVEAILGGASLNEVVALMDTAA
ncbi:acyltransferase domain-containing protein [Gordonia neofelifaecis]|uniref:Putative polyketide synthase n=1 Tax=Gordonia neofelifaecis NRRL B-59395 TaxID=644548 RepID=F1YJL9_9ACTN|nr:acyltransferase domain-containing protein [Gordonia neofelifaecis]EGD54951.1 putative polyketide synthase [Gordonia neofelifaecis NRRL B-59395]